MTTQPTLKKETSTGYIMHTNPMVSMLKKVTETSDNAMTYAGVARKCMFFMAMVCVGVLLALVLQNFTAIQIHVNGDDVTASVPALIFMAVCLLMIIVTPFLAFFAKKTTPVAGALFCLSTGYFYALLPMMLPEYQSMIILALVITVAIVTVMATLYATGVVKVGQKFRTIISTIFSAMVLSSVAMLVLFLIPGTRPMVVALSQNWPLTLGIAIGYVVIASLFLLVDFSTIQESVERKVPVSYEWAAAFSLSFSVIWLFLKVLDLLMTLKKKD